MKIDKETKRFLKKELKEYEKTTPMTEKERKILSEWVRAGKSVHENSSMAVYEGGQPVDFLDVYRYEESIRNTPETLSFEEGNKYLWEEHRIDRDGTMAPKLLTYDELRRKANRLYRTCRLYWEVLVANDLRDEACEYVQDHIDEELPFDWDIAQ